MEERGNHIGGRGIHNNISHTHTQTFLVLFFISPFVDLYKIIQHVTYSFACFVLYTYIVHASINCTNFAGRTHRLTALDYIIDYDHIEQTQPR